VLFFFGIAFTTLFQHFLQACHSPVILMLLSIFSFKTFFINASLSTFEATSHLKMGD